MIAARGASVRAVRKPTGGAPPSGTTRRRPFAVALVLVLTLVGTSLELHPAEHDAVSAVAAAEGETHMVTDAHPQRPVDCWETAAVDAAPRCPACLVRLQSRGNDPGHQSAVTAPNLPDRLAGVPDPRAASASRHVPSSRGPPVLL